MEENSYKNGLEELRLLIKKRRGGPARVSRLLKVPRYKVYNVLYGSKKDPEILKALIQEAELAKNETDPSIEIMSEYLKEKQ